MQMVRWVVPALLTGVVSFSGCVDEDACRQCIDEQVSLRIELIDEGLEPPGSLQSRDYYRQSCAVKIIDVYRRCAPRYWPVVVAGSGIAAVGAVILWRRRKRAREQN
ncbi:MAG: hypothetical protein JW797_20515 [Bradymonadales bacterium]|nr:hypothetical protein [Bradymonadales bacterium]